jgi:O-antigen/teichoic acid export membrane protein
MLNFSTGLIFFMIAARVLPKSDLGSLSSLTFFLILTSNIAQLSIPTAATKYVSEFLGRNETEKSFAVIQTARNTMFVSSFTMFMISLSLSQWFSKILWGTAEGTMFFITVSFASFFMTLFRTFISFLQGFQKFSKIAIAEVFAIIVNRSTSIILLFFGFGLTGIFIGWTVGYAVGLCAALLFLRQKSIHKLVTSYKLKSLLYFSLPLFVIIMISTFSDWADRMLLLLMSSNLATLGTYDLSIRAENMLTILSVGVGTTVLPALSKLYGETGKEWLPIAIKKSTRYLAFLVIPASIGLAIISRTALATLFGWQNTESLSLRILALTSIFRAFYTLLMVGLQSIGKTKIFIKIGILAIIVDVTSVIILTPFLGALGAAIARTLMTVTSFVYAYYALNQHFKVEFDSEALKKTFISSFIMAFPLILFELYLGNEMLPPFVLAVLEVSVGILIYVISLLMTKTLRENDFKILRKIAPKKMIGLINFIEKKVFR